MDVFEAVNSRKACRWFHDKPVDQNVIKELIKGASRAASDGNMQSWNVYALTGEPLMEIKRRAAEFIENNDLSKLETEFPMVPDNLREPYLGRRFRQGALLYGALGTSRDDPIGRLEQRKRGYQFFNAPVGLFITIDRGLGPSQWADLGGYINTLAILARGYGLDTCPQLSWIRLYKVIGEFLKLPAEQMLYCGMGIGYRDPDKPVNQFRSERAELDEFCRFYGFD